MLDVEFSSPWGKLGESYTNNPSLQSTRIKA
jgi:hypothetical protein